MPALPRLLLFDLDHVLVDYDHATRCRALARALGDEALADDIRIALFGPDGLEYGCDHGEYGLEAYLDLAHARHGWRWSMADFVAARREATAIDAGMLALCRALAPQARLAVFTNNGAWIGEHAATLLPGLAELFGADFVSSGELRASKPDPAAFRACCERLGVAPHEAFFTDDKAANAEGARRAGLDGFHFTGVAALRDALRERGFELPGD